MQMTTKRLLALALATGGLMAPTTAQQIPDPEDGPPIVTATLIDGQVDMRDVDTGKAIMLSKTLEMWHDKGDPDAVAPVIEFQPQPTGYDAIFTFTNNGKTARPLGSLNAGIFTLGQTITYPEFRYICEPVTVSYDNYKVRQAHYPTTTYSPAWVLQNDEYAVGVSLQYPILDYKHDTRLCLYSPDARFAKGEGGRGWRLEFLLSNMDDLDGANSLYNSGAIPPGETWTYVVSVRVTRQTDEWVRTLIPYRNWFRSAYGGVEYERDPRPISGRSFSAHENCSDDNPYGFGGSRPDLHGWGNIVTGLVEARSGWGTMMLWTAGGAYRHNDENNMAYQFASNWNSTPGLATATDPKVGFQRINDAGTDVAFWWGRSCQVADKWDDDQLESFDPDKQAHRQAAFAEMDMAVKAGARSIGLDTFSCRHTPVWKLVEWLDTLKARYPGVRFCAEPLTNDLIHRKISTYYRGHNDRQRVDHPDEIDIYHNPHYLADFLLPGHEIWGAFRWSQYENWFGMSFSDSEKEAQLQKIASMGYIPVCLTEMNLTVNADAARSWEFTVPADLRDDGQHDNGGGDDGGLDGGNNDDGGHHDDDGNYDPFPTFESFDAAFKAGDMRADLNGDGKLDFFDYTAWQNAHAGGGDGRGGGDGTVGGGSTGGTGNVGGTTRPIQRHIRGGFSGRPQTLNTAPKAAGGIIGAPGPETSLDNERNRRDGSGRLRRTPGAVPSPNNFTEDEVAQALARLRGQDAPASSTAGVDE
jgi:hypothetical protein